MGSQLTKNTNGLNQQQSSYSSLSSKLPSSNSTSNSKEKTNKNDSNQDNNILNPIVVVNRGPSNDTGIESSLLKLRSIEPLIKPLIPFGQSIVIHPTQPRLSVQPIVELGTLLQKNLNSASETVATKQQKIIEQIRLVEQQTVKISQVYCQEKQRRFNKAVENFNKFDEILILLDRCESDIEQLLTTFAKLNSALPETLCLENFQANI